jgi:hypothetical protein
MSVEETSVSAHLLNNNKENDNITLYDIDDTDISDETAQKQPTMKELLIEKFSLYESVKFGAFADMVERIKELHNELV